MRGRVQLIGGAFVLALVGAAGALATTFIKADIPTLKKMSESVVHARVGEIRAEAGDRGMIFTQVSLNVIRTLHGNASDEVVVRVPGGTIDGRTVKMEGAPEFQAGSQVVAFIGSWDDGAPRVVGYVQGVSRVSRDNLEN
jgi:hypothetical protein